MERRNPLESGNTKENWATSANVGGTPKAQNSVFGVLANEKKAQKKETKENLLASSLEINNLPASIFILAGLIAFVSAVLILAFRRYLGRLEQNQEAEQDAGSVDVPLD